jgi:hypothetical protein
VPWTRLGRAQSDGHLAVSANSPTFLGHRLWQETRIAVFKHSVDDRQGNGLRRQSARTALGTGWLRGGPLELFTESVRLHVCWHNSRDLPSPAR